MSAKPFAEVPIEEVQTYWDRRPCNIRHSQAEVGSRQYFDEVEARKYFVEPHIPAFAQFERWRDKRVLELGCGIGTDTMNFARAGAQVTAVDLSGESLALASQRAQVLGLADKVTFHQANLEQLSEVVPVEPYDLVYSFGVIHHTPHPDAAVAQARQYVAPGGMVKVMVYNSFSWKVFSTVVIDGHGRFWDADALVARVSEAQTGCPVTYTYNRREGRALLERHRLRVVETTVDHIFPYRLADYIEYRYVKRAWIRVLPPPVFRSLEHQLGWHLCLTAVPA